MVRGEEAGHFHEVVGMSIVVAGGLHSVTNTNYRLTLNISA